VKRILLVDDNTEVTEPLGILLSMHGYEARQAASGGSALAVVDQFVPEFALIDIGLPDMTGFELARRFRLDPRLENTTLIALTGDVSISRNVTAAAAVFDLLLAKPVPFERLKSVLAGDSSDDTGRRLSDPRSPRG
jgi:CheY-like chemotaxis protein